MKRRRGHEPGPGAALAAPRSSWILFVACLLIVCVSAAIAADSLVLKLDDSKIMTFRKMKRVWVTNPEVIDVVVSSYNELLLYSKSVGRTKLYVWDSVGRHEYSVTVEHLPTPDQVVRQLSNLLGRQFSYTVVDENTVLVEGYVDTDAEKERVERLVAAKSGGLKILSLVSVRRTVLTPAQEHQKAFEKLFPQQFRYSTIDDKTLVIEGEVGTADQKRRVEKILAAATGISVVDLIQCLEGMETPQQQRIASIRKAVGEKYEFLELEGKILVINGTTDQKQELDRIDKIVKAAGEDVTIINVVQLTTDDRPIAEHYAERLRSLFEGAYTFTPLGEDSLVAEGRAPSVAEAMRVDSILKLLGEDLKVVNLVSANPQDPAEQAVAMIQESLGKGYTARVVGAGTVALEGTLQSPSDQARIDNVLKAIPETVKVVNLVVAVTQDPAEKVAAMVRESLGEGFTTKVVGEGIIAIEGAARTPDDQARLDSVLAAMPETVKVINLVTRSGLASTSSLARKYEQALQPVLGEDLQFRSLGDDTLLVEGEVKTAGERERARKILKALEGTVKVLDLIEIAPGPEAMAHSPAARKADAIKHVIGERYVATAIDENTVVVQGVAPGAAEQQRLEGILKQLAGEVTVVSMVLADEAAASSSPSQRAVLMLQKAIGETYTVRQIGEDVVLVEGEAATAAELARVNTLTTAAPQGARVLNLVTQREAEASASKAAKYEQALKPILGEGITYRVVDDATLVVEGELATAGQKDRASKVISALQRDLNVLDLLTVKAGPTAADASPADKKAAVLGQILGDRYNAKALDDKTVMVNGTASSQEEQQRLAKILEQVAGDVTVVNMILQAASAETTPAERAIEKLKTVLPADLKLIALDDRTLLIEGIVPTTIERDRVEKVAEAMAKSGSLSVISAVLTEMQSKTPASRRIEHLRRIIGDKYNYIVWDEDTVLVEGQVESHDELDKIRTILKAADQDFKVGDLVTYGGKPVGTFDETTLTRLSQAIGEPYRVWQLKGSKVVVEGEAPDSAAKLRLDALVQAFAEGDIEILNLVTVAAAPTMPLEASAETLRTVLGNDFQVRTLQGRALVVEATVLSKADADRARAIIQAMGTDVPIVDLVTVTDPARRQVVAHVKVVDINRGYLKKLGVNWGLLGGDPATPTFADQPFLVKVQEGVDWIGQLAGRVDALKQNDAAKILAEPNLVVNDGESAQIVVGGEVPIPVPQTGVGAATVTIQYKEYGVVVRMKPQILPDGKSLRLEIEPEVSSIDPSTQVSIGGIAVPAFRTRKAKTIVTVPDGGTLLIGGLIQRDQTKVVRKIPLLSKLPIIGDLFTSKDWNEGYNELVILVTPEILKSVEQTLQMMDTQQ